MAPPYARICSRTAAVTCSARAMIASAFALLGNHLQARLHVRDRGQVDLDVDPGDGHRGARRLGVAADLGQQRGALSRVQGRGGTASRDRHRRGEPSQEAADLPVADGHSSSRGRARPTSLPRRWSRPRSCDDPVARP
jgi:hypothetical protein